MKQKCIPLDLYMKTWIVIEEHGNFPPLAPFPGTGSPNPKLKLGLQMLLKLIVLEFHPNLKIAQKR